jgi:drug/metabolite transporter (DMT)-like permease
MQKNWQVHLALGFVGLIYGANYIIAKGVMPDYLLPNAFIMLRVSVATVLFWIYHLLTSKEKVKDKKDYLHFAKCAVFGVMANQLIFFNGLNLGNPVNASIIMTMNPIIVLLISAWWLKERITRRKVIGILLGLIGAILLVSNKEISFDNDSFKGDIFIFLNATFYAIYLVLVKPLMHKYEPITVIKWTFLFGTFMIMPFGLVPLMESDLSQLDAGIWGSVAYVIIGTTFLAYLLNAAALKHVTSTIVGYYIYLQPVFATLITVALGLEGFKWQKMLYASIIFFGVYLVSKRTKQT